MAKYPNAALATAIIAYANDFGRRPSEVYADYLDHPRDYNLIFEYRGFLEMKRREEEEKMKAKT